MGLVAFNDYTNDSEKEEYLAEAMSYFNTAIAKGEDKFPVFYIARSAVHFVLGNTDAAENDLKKAQSIDKEDYAVLHASAFFYEGIGKMDESEKMRLKIIELFPNDVDAHVNYAFFCLDRDAQKSLKHYIRATELAPQSVDRWYDKGLLSRLLGKFDDAEEAFQQAIELSQDEDKKREIYTQLELVKQRQK